MSVNNNGGNIIKGTQRQVLVTAIVLVLLPDS